MDHTSLISLTFTSTGRSALRPELVHDRPQPIGSLARDDRTDVTAALDDELLVATADAQLFAHDEREARLTEPRRPDQQQVVERLATAPGRLKTLEVVCGTWLSTTEIRAAISASSSPAALSAAR